MNLTTATAKCPFCTHTASQIDSTRERAVDIATQAVARHVEAEHAEAAP